MPEVTLWGQTKQVTFWKGPVESGFRCRFSEAAVCRTSFPLRKAGCERLAVSQLRKRLRVRPRLAEHVPESRKAIPSRTPHPNTLHVGLDPGLLLSCWPRGRTPWWSCRVPASRPCRRAWRDGDSPQSTHGALNTGGGRPTSFWDGGISLLQNLNMELVTEESTDSIF